MTQLLSVGTRIRINPALCTVQVTKAFEGLEGTITYVAAGRSTPCYVINWDSPNDFTYKYGTNLYQFNMTATKIIAIAQLSKKDLICNKVIQLQKKFNERKLSHDF